MIEELARTPISRIEQRDAIFVAPATRVRDVLDLMLERHRGAALVVDGEGRLAGIFTERDVLLKLSGDAPPVDAPISDFMTADPQRITSDRSVTEVLRRMQRSRFRHLPVVDANGRPEGMISIRDVLTWLAEHFPDEFLNLPPEPVRSSGRLYGG